MMMWPSLYQAYSYNAGMPTQYGWQRQSYGYPSQPNSSYPYPAQPQIIGNPGPYMPSVSYPVMQRPLMPVKQIAPVQFYTPQPVWQNRLKELFFKRQAITYALHLRTFAAEDKNGDGKIDPLLGENGNFLRAIKLLPELKALGVNNIHLLPINPVGKIDRLGEYGSPGSVYAPEAYDKLNEEYDEPNNGLTVEQEAKMFVDAAHKLGIHVMVDIPSCASVDLANARPDLMARDASGKLLTPTNWIDIRMFVQDSPALREYYQRFFDLMIDRVGVDGFRADVARARTMDFWKHFIGKYPDKAWLAESYTEEDASPMQNIPRDVPGDLLRAGFDAIYGQFHIFHDFDANQYIQYLKDNRTLLQQVGPQKSIIGSFWTHDDPSVMDQGGALYCKLIAGLMATQPDTNPYIMDGFLTGHRKHFDIFNYRMRPGGTNPDIGIFLQKVLALRQSPQYGPVLSYGKFIPLQVSQNPDDPRVIAFMRQLGNKTLLVVANKDVNAAHNARIEIPGLQADQKLVNLAPPYGDENPLVKNTSSRFVVYPNQLEANLACGRFYLFELDLPPVENNQPQPKSFLKRQPGPMVLTA